MTALVLSLCVLCVLANAAIGIGFGEVAKEGSTAKAWLMLLLSLVISVGVPYGCFYLGRVSP